jgi:hypothetical protein
MAKPRCKYDNTELTRIGAISDAQRGLIKVWACPICRAEYEEDNFSIEEI